MSPAPVLELFDVQKVKPISADLLRRLQERSERALAMVRSEPEGPEPVLAGLDFVEVSFIDDETIARVHVDFMDIPGATDVITFHHGEVLISVETAEVQAGEHGEPYERELFRYVVHGLLHLHGYLDGEPEQREEMHRVQERIVQALW